MSQGSFSSTFDRYYITTHDTTGISQKVDTIQTVSVWLLFKHTCNQKLHVLHSYCAGDKKVYHAKTRDLVIALVK